MNSTVAGMKMKTDEMVWGGVQIEGIGATFAQTKELLDNAVASGLSNDDALKIVSIKHAWEYLFDHYDEVPDFDTYCAYNAILGAGGIVKGAGSLRGAGEGGVTTGGNDPFIPRDNVSEETFKGEISTAIETAYDSSEAAATMFLLLVKAQYFHDGNKRSALMLANHYLAHEDAGYAFMVSEEDREWLYDEIVSYDVGSISLDDACWDIEERCIRPTSKKVIAPDEGER